MRFKKVEGIDYKRGAREYAQKLGPSDRHHLFTKPFYNLAHKHERWEGDGLDPDTHRHFCDFANLAMALALPPGARVLDVGCGSGWLCEYFARFGYKATGIDLSSEMIEMAHERLSSVPFGLDHETSLKARFLVHDIETAPLNETFDAIICYDSLHHFEDEHAVLKHLSSMMEPGGQLFVLEGEVPPAGSATETELRNVMQQYETLESPFPRDYLLQLLREHGFAIVGDYISINGLFEREMIGNDRLLRVDDGAAATFNYLLCKKIADGDLQDSRNPGVLTARITARGKYPSTINAGGMIKIPLEIANTGDTVWLVSQSAPKGTVRIGVKILNERNELVSEVHGSPRLARALAPGETVVVNLAHTVPQEPGNYYMKVDLVCQDICWFEQHGSKPLLISFQVRE
jgi:2-polyprenyl-3-methyl-5-hydroxy-6-metoxy-1,4-benzoquinol methylase